jgi:hypothetical protein
MTEPKYSDVAIQRLVALHHKPELLQKPGMVCQLWEDGEVTLQKSGELLWQRNLHCIAPGHPVHRVVQMPMPYGSHSFAVIESTELAEQLRSYWL